MSKFTGEIAVSSAASGTVMDAVLSGYSAYGLYVGLDVPQGYDCGGAGLAGTR